MLAKLTKFFSTSLLVVVVNVLILSSCEGLASFALLFKSVAQRAESLESYEVYSQYDPDLGWTQIPNAEVEDYPQAPSYIKINSQGFRADRDYSRAEPAGKVRIICSGDSFTFGFGVSNPETWCKLLEKLDPRFETINMGQTAFGIDQAYLWYEREAGKFDHSIHIFSYITYDFGRMQSSRYGAYQKPMIGLANGALEVKNVPVPKSEVSGIPWLMKNLELFKALRSYSLLAPVFGSSAGGVPTAKQGLGQAYRVSSAIFGKLQTMHKEQNRAFLVVHLPVDEDYERRISDVPRQSLRNETKKRGIHYLDLIPIIRKLPKEQAVGLYLKEDRHFSVTGNEWAAKQLYETLLTMPEVQSKLAALAAEGVRNPAELSE